MQCVTLISLRTKVAMHIQCLCELQGVYRSGVKEQQHKLGGTRVCIRASVMRFYGPLRLCIVGQGRGCVHKAGQISEEGVLSFKPNIVMIM